MATITRELLRKRSEHNECMISTMEELTLHQEEVSAEYMSDMGVYMTQYNAPLVAHWHAHGTHTRAEPELLASSSLISANMITEAKYVCTKPCVAHSS